jgi:adenosylcobinamide-GDP ribazoletransferase
VVATVLTVAGGAAMVATGHATPGRAAAVVGAMMGVTLVSSYRYMRRLGGFTGDFLGATEQLCELAGYGALAWGLTP